MAAVLASSLSIYPINPNKIPSFSTPENPNSHHNLGLSFQSHRLPSRPFLCSGSSILFGRCASVSGKNLSVVPSEAKNYEFSDGGREVELRFDIGALGVDSSSDIFVDVDDSSLLIRVKASGTLRNLMQTDCLFERIKPADTIWYIDEDQLVVNLKKHIEDLKWPDVMESWESLKVAAPQLLKGTSIYVVGESTEINQAVAKDLAVCIGYTPLITSDLLESFAGQSVDSWVAAEVGPVAEAESLVLQSLSSYVRAVVATIGGRHGAAAWHDKWQHLHAGFTVWLSKSEAANEASAREEALRSMQDGSLAYAKADVIVKLSGWDRNHAQGVAHGCLKALKQLILSDKQLTEKKRLYIRLGCRGDWPNIKTPGWDPSSGGELPL